MRLTGIILIAAVSSAALTGCALRDPRDDYGYGTGSDGLWNSSWDLIDWNFPTSVTQGPIEAPKRLQPERTAIGVTWATRNPLPLHDQLPAQDAPAVESGDATTPTPANAAAPDDARADARERGGVR